MLGRLWVCGEDRLRGLAMADPTTTWSRVPTSDPADGFKPVLNLSQDFITNLLNVRFTEHWNDINTEDMGLNRTLWTRIP